MVLSEAELKLVLDPGMWLSVQECGSVVMKSSLTKFSSKKNIQTKF